MSLTLVIIINLIADAALIATLAYLMSRADRLTPHLAASHTRDILAVPATRTREQDGDLANAA